MHLHKVTNYKVSKQGFKLRTSGKHSSCSHPHSSLPPSGCASEEKAQAQRPKAARVRVSCVHFIGISGSTTWLTIFILPTINASKKKNVIRRKHSTPSSFKSSFGLASGLEGTWCELHFWLMNGEVLFPVMPTYEAKRLSPYGGRHKDIYLHSRRNSTVAGV